MRGQTPVSQATKHEPLIALKTWLRNTLKQERLNSNAVCNIHKNFLGEVDLAFILNNFVSRYDVRKGMFGLNKF